MQNFSKKFTIINTKFGFFGVLGSRNSAIKTTLPIRNKPEAKRLLLCNLDGQAEYDPQFFKHLQPQIIAYFKGEYSGNFEDVKLEPGGMSKFAIRVLNACRKIPPGQTVSYTNSD